MPTGSIGNGTHKQAKPARRDGPADDEEILSID